MFRTEPFFIIFPVFTVHNHIRQRWINIGEISVRLLVLIVYLFFLTTCMTDSTYDFSLSLSFTFSLSLSIYVTSTRMSCPIYIHNYVFQFFLR